MIGVSLLAHFIQDSIRYWVNKVSGGTVIMEWLWFAAIQSFNCPRWISPWVLCIGNKWTKEHVDPFLRGGKCLYDAFVFVFVSVSVYGCDGISGCLCKCECECVYGGGVCVTCVPVYTGFECVSMSVCLKNLLKCWKMFKKLMNSSCEKLKNTCLTSLSGCGPDAVLFAEMIQDIS
jgi:hypothetical protein